MITYHEAYNGFSITALAADILSGDLSAGLNPCVECCDRWADSGRVALHWMGDDGRRDSITFATLKDDTARFANVLWKHGVGPGDVVAGMLPRVPEMLVAILGTWRAGAIYQPLFTAFGPSAIESRIGRNGGSGAKLVIIDAANRAKLDEVPSCPPVIVLAKAELVRESDSNFIRELSQQTPNFEPVMRRGEDPFILIFTSGTTGRPKGVACPISALLQFAVFVRDGLGVNEDDVFWCFADPGWALGMYATIAGPLLLGHSTTLYQGGFSVESTVKVITELGVTNLMAAPTVFRMLRAADPETIQPMIGRLRAVSGGGEPLNAELNRWSEHTLGLPIHEAYGQTEMGVNVCNHQGLLQRAKPGSIGLPSPGFAFAILDDELNPVPVGEPGVLAVHRGRSPLFFFSGYWQADTPSFRGDWYVTGDVMRQDEDGYFYFVSRNDDIITSSGYRIGPADVEGAIMEHEAITEVAVIGKPDPERTEIVAAFVVLRAGFEASSGLAEELRQHVRHRYAAHAYPREIYFVGSLPKTPSGKVQRFLLRSQTPADKAFL